MSFSPSVTLAFCYARQLENAKFITDGRIHMFGETF